jgi:hypothetical protein
MRPLIRTHPPNQHRLKANGHSIYSPFPQVATAAEIAAVVEERQAEEARLSEEAEAKSRKSNNKKKK